MIVVTEAFIYNTHVLRITMVVGKSKSPEAGGTIAVTCVARERERGKPTVDGNAWNSVVWTGQCKGSTAREGQNMCSRGRCNKNQGGLVSQHAYHRQQGFSSLDTNIEAPVGTYSIWHGMSEKEGFGTRFSREAATPIVVSQGWSSRTILFIAAALMTGWSSTKEG